MYAATVHGHGRMIALVTEVAVRLRALWQSLAVAFVPPPEPAEIDWEDGEGY